MWWYRALHQRLVDSVAPIRGRVLDAGCGTGGFLNVLRARRGDLHCVGLEWAASAASRAASKSRAAVACGSVNSMPFAPATFDAVVLADVLCHGAVDPPTALAEVRRVLRPGGRIVINMPAYAWLMSEHDERVHNTRRMTATQTAGMLRAAGFQTVRARYWNSLLLPLMVLRRKVQPRGQVGSDVALFPPWLDAMLFAVTSLERSLPMALPAGGSVLAIAENP